MAILETVEFSQGEQFPISATFTVTQSVNGDGMVAGIVAGSTFTVRDSNGVIYQIDHESGVYAEVDEDGQGGTVAFDLASATFATGIYYGKFSFMPVSTDLMIRILEPTIRINVTAPVEVIATFDPTLLSGLVRILSRDTDMLNPINDDTTVNAMILLTGYNGSSDDLWETLDITDTALFSAANCLDLMARDAAKVALIEKIGALSENTKVTHDALREEADLLRSRAIQGFVPSQVTGIGSRFPFPLEYLQLFCNYGFYGQCGVEAFNPFLNNPYGCYGTSALDRW